MVTVSQHAAAAPSDQFPRLADHWRSLDTALFVCNAASQGFANE